MDHLSCLKAERLRIVGPQDGPPNSLDALTKPACSTRDPTLSYRTPDDDQSVTRWLGALCRITLRPHGCNNIAVIIELAEY